MRLEDEFLKHMRENIAEMEACIRRSERYVDHARSIGDKSAEDIAIFAGLDAKNAIKSFEEAVENRLDPGKADKFRKEAHVFVHSASSKLEDLAREFPNVVA